MRATTKIIGGLCGALFAALVLCGWAFWGWSEAAADKRHALGQLQQLEDARTRETAEHGRQQERDADRLDQMARACSSETDTGFDAGYRLGVARCGLDLQ